MASVLDLVKHYQHAIEKYPNDEQRVLKSIDKLYNLDVTVQHLQDTGVGRTVNALRKEPGNVGQAAKALVYKWKVMVAAEESDQEDHNNDTTSQNGHANGRSYEDSSRQSNNRHSRHENSVKEPEIEDKHNKQINGDYGNKRKYHSSEEGDPHTKKGKYSSSKDNSYKIKTEAKIKTEPKNESEDSQDDSSQSDSDSENSQSSEEDRKPEVKVKNIEKTNRHETSKQASSSVVSRDKHKLESDPKNTIERSDKYHRHSSSSNRHSSDKVLKEKSNYSDSHKRSKEIERSNEIKEKEHKYLEKEKKHRDESTSKHSERHKSSSSLEKNSSSSKKGSSSKSSSESFDIPKSSSSEKYRSSNSSERHKSTSSSEKHKSSATEKQKINSDKYSSQSDKSSSHIDKHSSSKSGKEKHKHSEKETNDKHKSKDNSSSKDKHSSSSNYKSKDKGSSNEKEYSEKSEKKHSKDKESKYDKQHLDHEKSKKKKHKSSKSKDSEPKKKREDSDDGIDCGSGASFAEALGMISPAKPKKKPTFRDTASPNSSNEDLSPATLLAPCAKLAPLPALEISALPEISNNYRPRPPPKFLPHFTDDEALSAGISSKNQRTKVYSGNKVIGKITTLYELCVQVLQEHIDALEYTGGVPYEILKPVVDKATPHQLFMLEHYNAYLMDDTDHLWQKFCEKNFRNKKRAEMETWREMYMRCQEEQEIKLKSLTANIRIAQEAKKAPIKQTKMAYVDSVVKPPRNILKKQAQHGTAFAATASPAARVASLAAAPNVLKGGRPAPVPISTSSSSSFKPKKAPLMQKALQFMRGRKR